MPSAVVKTNAGNLALRMKHSSRAVSDELLKAERQNAQDAMKQAVNYSSGAFYRPGRGKGRPYSRRTPHPPAPAYIVNVQSGAFRRSWKARTVARRSGTTSTLYNTAGHSGNFTGAPTKYMIGRPILQAVTEWLRRRRVQRLREAKNRAMRQR